MGSSSRSSGRGSRAVSAGNGRSHSGRSHSGGSSDSSGNNSSAGSGRNYSGSSKSISEGDSRRSFIRKIFAGSAGVALGGLALGAAPRQGQPGVAGPFSGLLTYPVTPLTSLTPGISLTPAASLPGESHKPLFPFMKYAGRYNFGDYIPKDQGGKFIQMLLLSSEGDHQIAAAVRAGILKEVYGDPIGWQRYEKSEIEKSVWLNRFYFLPSFARLYHLTGDRSYLDDMMALIRQWIDDNPRLPDSHRTTYNWRDMQVAWRSIHFSWCYYLAEEGLADEEKSLIIRSLNEHAHILLTGFGQAKLNEFNHQSHGGLAMLYLGILFPELDDAEELFRKGITIITHHLAHAFYPDGGNVEQMFGYYPFQAHLFRDAYLLCTANGYEPPDNSLPMLEMMATYLTAIERPDGTVPQVNDSYEMPVEPTVETINEILGERAVRRPRGSVLFPDTQVAVMRSGGEKGWYLLANPASVIGAHAHAGRLGFELWHNGMPLLTESGCCNYDDPALVSWYRTTRAHNSVVIDGITEEATSSDRLWVARRETPNRITGWDTEREGIVSLVMVSPPEEATNASVSWSRKITLVGSRLALISDHFESDREHTYEVLLHFPPSEVKVGESGRSLMMRGESTAEIYAVDPSGRGAFTVTDTPVSIAGRTVQAPMAQYRLRAEGSVTLHMVVVPRVSQSGSGSRPPVVKRRRGRSGSVITVRHENGKKTRMVLPDKNI